MEPHIALDFERALQGSTQLQLPRPQQVEASVAWITILAKGRKHDSSEFTVLLIPVSEPGMGAGITVDIVCLTESRTI